MIETSTPFSKHSLNNCKVSNNIEASLIEEDEFYFELKCALDSLKKEPKDSTVNNILNFSKTF